MVVIIGNDALLAAAPATPVQVAHACLRRGFTVAVPVTWGDELLAAEAVRQLASRARGPAVMCVCPFVRSRLLAPGPDLAPFLVSLVPPPVATARYLRTVYGDRGVHITYIGACPGAEDHAIDARLTPDAFLGELAEHGISLAEQPLVFDSIVPPDRRRWCSLPGGVPSAEVLWSDTDTRTLVEIERDDISTDLAQHIIARDHVLLDLAPSLGCSCSGSIPSLTPRSARVAVTALEPPRALGPVIEAPIGIALDVPVSAESRVAESPKPADTPAVAPRTQQELDHEARERALDMILGGEPEPPAATPPPRRHSPRAETRIPAPPPAARPGEMTMIEPVIARAEQQMASAASPLVLETLIDDILIEPLIIPDTKPPSDIPAGTSEAAREVVVELDVVREVATDAPATGVRHANGASAARTTSPVENAGAVDTGSIELDRVRLEPVELPDPSDVEVATSEAETMVGTPMQGAFVDDELPFDDDAVAVSDDHDTEGDEASETTLGVRRRTPPAMPARHPASTIPKAVSADGRPLPRAYVAKRRVTPTGSAVIPPAVNAAVPELAPAPVAPLPLIESPVAATEPTAIEPDTVLGALESQTIAVPSEPEPLVMQVDAPAAPVPQLDEEAPSVSESVWGVTVEAPVVAKPTVAEPTAERRPVRPVSMPIEVPSETAPESRPESIGARAANSNALLTIMVVALVTLVVSVFVLLRR